jgi:pimeloyl-ACP methyl ester carboxylesterase
MDTYHSVLLEVLDSLNVKMVDVAGNSLGGYIAWYMALNSPDRVRKLVLIDAAGYPNANNRKPLAFRLAEIPYLNKALTFITPRFIVRNSIKSLYADKSKVTEKLIDCYFELSLRAGNRQAFLDRWRTRLEDSSYQKITTIKNRTLILWGSEDHFIPVDRAHEFHRDLPNDTLIVLPNNGHMPMEESPQVTAAIVLEFLSRN